MDKKISTLIQKYSDNELLLDKLVVSSCCCFYDIEIGNGYLARFQQPQKNQMEEDINMLAENCSIENVISIFEQAIPQAEKTANGAVYTPKFIRDYIVEQTFKAQCKPIGECLCADIACGCGAFIYTLAVYVHENTRLPFRSIYHQLYGIDISETSIGRAKILLALLAKINHEDVEDNDFRLYCGDTLTFNISELPRVKDNKGLDIIVGNPPYVRSKHIDADVKKNLTLWKTSKVGNADLYIPFFEIGVSSLNETGVLGFITVNSFFKSVNARALRKYFSENHVALKIIDFGEQLVFKKKLAYTCLAFISKKESQSLHYSKANISDIENTKRISFSSIDYDTLDSHKGWHLNNSDVLRNIERIENAGEALGDKYVIKNGIATLANDVFIFRPVREDSNYYYLQKNGKEYPIEKGICRDIIKPNILKSEAEIPQKEEKIIYPYDANNEVITEQSFIVNYPYAYSYLESCRKILDARDKGEGNYGAWYAFGRTQAISDSGKKLLFPYISDIPHFVYTPQKDMLIYCGYAIYNDSETELLFLKRVLESSVFDYYMKNTSKPYATGYYSYAKNYVKSFGIYPFSEAQKEYIISLNTKNEVDEYVKQMYDVAI